VPSGLPDVVLPCLGGGREVRLAGLRGKPMMINVWAQWCGPCREEAPYLADVATTNKSDLMILGIDHADPQPALAIEFAQLSTWKYPQLADPDVVLRAALQITGPPQTFFVRPDGTIAYRHAGPFKSADEIRELAHKQLGVSP
jgi:cytochrome c biogenesis protein CcmG, thiol:disulfide interchange protein DsbE